MKTKAQIDAQYMRISRELDKAIIRGDKTLVASRRWDIAFNAWYNARNRN